MITVKIDSRTLKNALHNVEAFSDSQKDKVKRQVALSALEIEKLAKQECPVKTGRLRSSINVEFRSDGYGAIVATNVKYAAAVEFGSKGRPAKPFLFPATEKVRSRFLYALRKIFKV